MIWLPLGPVVGSLYMCGYLIDSSNVGKLKKLGVKDSKLITPVKRRALVPELRKIAERVVVTRITAEEIDTLRTNTNLNRIEIAYMQGLINEIGPDKVVIDAIEANTKKFKAKVLAGLKNKKVNLICENYADKNHLEVGAASIIAKVRRDAEIERLQKQFGFTGSGYPSDDETIKFLKKWICENNTFPDFVRKSWITAKNMIKSKEQKKLGDF